MTPFLSGFRTPTPHRKRWLHQLLAKLPEIERVVMAMHLQGCSQREIAGAVGVSQPAVCFRLKAAKRRLVLFAKFPEPPVTFDEARAHFTKRDAEILVRLQSADSEQVARDLGIRWHGLAKDRARVMRAQVPPDQERLRTLLDLVCTDGPSPLTVRDQRGVYRAPKSDGATCHSPADY